MTAIPTALEARERVGGHAAAGQTVLARPAIPPYARRVVDPPRLKFLSRETAVQINPFVKFRGLEVFGTVDRGQGKATAEAQYRKLSQEAVDVVYRFLSDQLYVGGRYNTATMRLQGMTQDVGADRTAFAAGWQISPLILLKGEYVKQQYNDFPTTDRRSGGQFKGFILEGVVAF